MRAIELPFQTAGVAQPPAEVDVLRHRVTALEISLAELQQQVNDLAYWRGYHDPDSVGV